MLIVMRGLPGSGKSTEVRQLQANYYGLGISCSVCSNDNYSGYYKTGEYKWTPEAAKEAKKYCKELFLQALKNDVQVIILDNTNLSPKIYREYEELARKAHHDISFVAFRPPLENPTALKEYCEACAARNKHGVSLQMIQQMVKAWVD